MRECVWKTVGGWEGMRVGGGEGGWEIGKKGVRV